MRAPSEADSRASAWPKPGPTPLTTMTLSLSSIRSLLSAKGLQCGSGVVAAQASDVRAQRLGAQPFWVKRFSGDDFDAAPDAPGVLEGAALVAKETAPKTLQCERHGWHGGAGENALDARA